MLNYTTQYTRTTETSVRVIKAHYSSQCCRNSNVKSHTNFKIMLNFTATKFKQTKEHL